MRPSTRTRTWRAPRSASSRRSSRAPPGPATWTRSPATCARSSSAPRRADGQAAQGAHHRVPLAGGRRARAPRVHDGRHAPRVRRHRDRLAAVARGRLAARAGVPVRAPRRAVGDRRHRADHAPEGAARPLPHGQPGRAPLDSRRAARARGRELPRARDTVSGPDPAAFATLLCDYCLEVEPGQQVLVRSTALAAPLLLELQRALLEREAWPLLRTALPGQEAGFWSA